VHRVPLFYNIIQNTVKMHFYGVGIFMAVLWNRADHYIFAL